MFFFGLNKLEGVKIDIAYTELRGESWNTYDSRWGQLLRIYTFMKGYTISYYEPYYCGWSFLEQILSGLPSTFASGRLSTPLFSPSITPLLIQYVQHHLSNTLSPSPWRGCINSSLIRMREMDPPEGSLYQAPYSTP